MKITIETDESVIEIVVNEGLPADLSSDWYPVERVSVHSLTDRSVGVDVKPHSSGETARGKVNGIH